MLAGLASGLVVATLGLAQPPPEAAVGVPERPLKALTFGLDVVPGAGPGQANAGEELSFRVEPEPRIEGSTVRAVGYLENPTAHAVRLGFRGLAGGKVATPFRLDFDVDPRAPARIFSPNTRLPTGPWQLEVPAGSAVRFEAVLLLDQFAYEGSPTVPLAWSFGADALQKTGRLSAKLPGRPPGTAHYFIEDDPVSKDRFEAYLKDLSDQQGWYCAERSDGGETGYTLRNTQGQRFQVRERSITVGITGSWSSVRAITQR